MESAIVMTRSPISRSQCRLLILGLLTFSACTGDAPSSALLAPRATLASAAAGSVTVKSTSPDTATVDSTLDVHVFGSGFDAGSRANWAIKGVVSPKVRTNSTRFVSSTELVANITIAADAPLASYDVIVTASSGKGGIGTECFVVTPKTTDLGTLGGTDSEAFGINNLGQVVGWAFVPSGVEHAFLWTKATGMLDLGTLGGSSRALAINDNGQVVGSSNTLAGQHHAFLWTATDGMRDLGTLGGTLSEATGISQNGVIVGSSFLTGGGTQYACVWVNGVIESLGTATSRATGVNNALQIVGWFGGYTPSDATAMVWTKSAGVWTSEAIPAPSTGSASQAYGINELGQIVGGFRLTTGQLSAFSWTRASGSKELPWITRGTGAQGYAISNQGRLVGKAWDRSGFTHATFWDPSGSGWNVKVSLGTMKSDAWVNSVNDNHQGVGRGTKGTVRHAMLWEVP
ncbi:MAG: repeat protein [Gemmatimonadales bacterium]|nr:repeat protein [Gemmatimonadales bacterium]